MDKLTELIDEMAILEDEITALEAALKDKKAEIQKQINKYKKEIKSILPKGYWFTYDIDMSWKHPKKYSIRDVYTHNNTLYITVKEVFKKKPWFGFTGEHRYSLDGFFRLNRYKTAEEATLAYHNRICPKCGGKMGDSANAYCMHCMSERYKKKYEFEANHRFYCKSEDCVYIIEYTDELTTQLGFEGQKFVLQRLDTKEIIETCNLWTHGKPYKEEDKNLPNIEFIY